jgi:hypothetical protein
VGMGNSQEPVPYCNPKGGEKVKNDVCRPLNTLRGCGVPEFSLLTLTIECPVRVATCAIYKNDFKCEFGNGGLGAVCVDSINVAACYVEKTCLFGVDPVTGADACNVVWAATYNQTLKTTVACKMIAATETPAGTGIED